jgi:hypothetical protein
MALNAPTPDEVQKSILLASHTDHSERTNTFSNYYPKKTETTEIACVTRTFIFFNEDNNPIAYALVDKHGGQEIRVGSWNVSTISEEAPAGRTLGGWEIGEIGYLGAEKLILTNIDGGIVPDVQQHSELTQNYERRGRSRQVEEEHYRRHWEPIWRRRELEYAENEHGRTPGR